MSYSPVTELPSKTLYYPGAPTSVKYKIASTEYTGYASNTGYGGYNTSVLWNTKGPNDMVRARVKATLGDFDAEDKKISIKLELQECRINGDYADTRDKAAIISFTLDNETTKYSWPGNTYLSDGAPIRHSNEELKYVPENYFTTLATHTINLQPNKQGICTKEIKVCVTSSVANIYLSEKTFTLEFNCFDFGYITNVGKPIINIIDNYDNTFTINVAKGANGINNTATGVTNLFWGYSALDLNEPYKNKTPINLDIFYDSTGNAYDTRTVSAKAATIATYGENQRNINSLSINQYVAPGKPGKLTLHPDSLKNGRLTVKQDWKYTWTAAIVANETSPIKGYQIQLYKNNIVLTGLKYHYDASEKLYKLSKDSNETNNTEYLNIEDLACLAIIFNPNDFEFKPGDKVKVSVRAYSRFGKNNDNSTLLSAVITSDETEIQNAGIVHVKVGDKWTEGQVYVKVGNDWKEAESVYVKTSTDWTEST